MKGFSLFSKGDFTHDKLVKVFSNNDFSVRTIQDESGKFWFVAKDVAEALEYSETSLASMNKLCEPVPDIWKGRKRFPTPGGEQDMLCLTEEGLYFFLGRSDKPRALPYQMWIAGDVAPSIRQTGSYSAKSNSEDVLNRRQELNLRGAEILQHMIDYPSFPITDESKAVLAHEIVKLITGREFLNMLPEVTEKGYSATEIGNILGVSANKIGRIAIAHGIKPPEGKSNQFGTWRVSKSRYSSHECPTFIYNEKALDWFRDNAEVFD